MLHRVITAAACVLFYAVGSIIASGRSVSHDNRHNWRAYLDGLTGTTTHVDAFEASCSAKHGAFEAPQPTLSHPFTDRDFGHALDACWPPAPSSPRHPTSAVTSLVFLLVAAARPSLLSAALALLAGGSYRHHASGDASGRALDHAAVGVVAAFMCSAIVRQLVDQNEPFRFSGLAPHVANWLALAASCAIIAAGNIETNAYAVSVASMSAGLLLSALNPSMLPNILLPIGVGYYITHLASDHQHEAECTGSMDAARAYDRLHAVWHISVAAAASEALTLARHPEALLDWPNAAVNPLSVCVAIALPFAANAPHHADAGVATLFACACLWTAWQHYRAGAAAAVQYSKLGTRAAAVLAINPAFRT